MYFKLGNQWINDRDHVTNLIRRLFGNTDQSAKYVKNYDEGDVLLHEGDKLTDIYILMDGTVELRKKKPDTRDDYPITRLQAGSFIGIIAFTTGEPSLTSAVVTKKAAVLKIPDADIRDLLSNNKRFKNYIDELILANLVDRFRNTIILQMELDSVNDKLKEERNESQKAYRELKEAQSRLIYQEKMVTLGQLVAGFAHEVNNPTASLLRSNETLELRISEMMKRFDGKPEDEQFTRTLYNWGKKTVYLDTATLREKVNELKNHFPQASASQLRLLAHLSEAHLQEIKNRKITNQTELDFYLNYFELGKMSQNIGSAGKRIASLVKGLKSYSRTDADVKWEEIDIREGLYDTLQLTSNRIKYYDVDLDLPEVPVIRAIPAALNQVWTNIILNAADAMGKNGSLNISCNFDKKEIWVNIRDSGPGIKKEHINKIFDSNFSTKKSDVKFGLGLGLSISKNIVEQHGGTISANNSAKGGAIFTVRLPLKLDKEL